METLSWHSNESTWATPIKKTQFMSWTCMQSLSSIPLTISEKKIFEYFFENLPFMLPWQPIKVSNLDNIHMNRTGLLKKHFCKKNTNICSETAKIANFPFSHFKSIATISCHSNHSSYPIGTKNTVPLAYRCYVWIWSGSWLQRKCCLKMLMDDRRTMDVCLYYKLTYEPSAQVS